MKISKMKKHRKSGTIAIYLYLFTRIIINNSNSSKHTLTASAENIMIWRILERKSNNLTKRSIFLFNSILKPRLNT
jgi:hypothetical protein